MPSASFGFEKIAHRGASGEAPENTLPAFELALQKYRCEGVEIDLRLTRDGVPVVFHDAALERTTEGEGLLASYLHREIKALDAGYRFDPKGKGEFPYRGRGIRIPTLEEALTQFPESRFLIELKEPSEKMAANTLEVLKRIPEGPRVILGSFRGSMARRLRRLCKNSYETFLAEDEIIRLLAAFRLGFKKIRGPALHASLPRTKYGIRLDGTSWIEFLHRQGVRVYYWTVNEPKEMEELIRRGADGILTDYPGRLQSLAT